MRAPGGETASLPVLSLGLLFVPSFLSSQLFSFFLSSSWETRQVLDLIFNTLLLHSFINDPAYYLFYSFFFWPTPSQLCVNGSWDLLLSYISYVFGGWKSCILEFSCILCHIPGTKRKWRALAKYQTELSLGALTFVLYITFTKIITLL